MNCQESEKEKDCINKEEAVGNNGSFRESKKCRYYDKGHCKYKNKCIYLRNKKLQTKTS